MQKTKELLIEAYEEMKKNDINKCVIASTSGETAKLAYDIMKGKEIIVVRKHYGAKEKNIQEMSKENENYLREKNIKIVTATHVFGGIGRSVRKKYNTWQIDEIIASTLRIFGSGVKVAIEISMMATDAGYVDSGERIIAIGGNKVGASNAVIINAVNTSDFFDIKVNKII